MIVVDASVVVKLFLDEPGTAPAQALMRASRGAIYGPDLLSLETSAALVRKANVEKSLTSSMRAKLQAVSALMSSGITLVRTSAKQLGAAVEMALSLGHPLKDCIYLALATELGCPLVTADVRFATKAQSTRANVVVLSG